jgi:hypothetical protein
MSYGPQSNRIISALQRLHTASRETRFTRIVCARTQGRGGFMRFSYLNGGYDNGQAIIMLRSAYRSVC